MRDKITAFKQHVIEMSARPGFVHHKWFVTWHLEIVEKLAMELCDHHPETDRDLVELMVWLHDYGKILDFDNQYTKTLSAGRQKLEELGFPSDIVTKAIDYIETLGKKLEVDLYQAPLEIQIVSSADGCAHMVGPFMHVFWNEASDKTFAGKTFEELMQINLAKVDKDWRYKIVLPEARRAFETRYQLLREQSGELPDKFFA